MMRPALLRRSLLAGSLLVLLSACASHAYQPAYLNGTVSLKEPVSLPLSTTLVRVRLIGDSAEADAPGRLLAEQTLEKPKAFPLGFSLCYDQHAIARGAHYSLQAQVFVDGELRLQNRSPVTAFGTGAPDLSMELIK